MKDRIRQARKAAGLTQLELSERLGTAKGTITAYETGTRSPANAIVKALCNELNVNETWLLTGEGQMHDPPTREQEIASLVTSIITDDNAFRQALISTIMQLNADQMRELELGLYKELKRLNIINEE